MLSSVRAQSATLELWRRLRARLSALYVRNTISIADGGPHERLGTRNGGWFVPVHKLDETSICYCFGAGEDISFDVELINRFNCEVFTFDPTPRAVKHVNKLIENTREGVGMEIDNDPNEIYNLKADQLNRLHFFDYGVWEENTTLKFYAPRNPSHVSHSILNLQATEDYFEARCYTVKHITQMLGHKSLALIKLDVEGAEYCTISSLFRDGLKPGILCAEFDEGYHPRDDEFIDRIRSMIQTIVRAGYAITHVDIWDYTFMDREMIGR